MTSPPAENIEQHPSPYTDPNAARDLGFGVRVAGYSRLRLLNRDGSFNVDRRGRGLGTKLSPYHALIGMGWGSFLGIVVAFYLTFNTLFALVYLACGHGALAGPGIAGVGPAASDFLRAFFFSIETFATIGYGHVSPSGFAANFIITIESLVGLFCLALATGLIFARFSRPTAQIIYSRYAVIAPYQGMTAFMFRCANQRNNQLTEVSVKLLYSYVVDRGGGRTRAFTVLPLEFDKVTFFALSWTVVHAINDVSPLRGLTLQDLIDNEAEFLILISGMDETFAQQVHSRTSYKGDELIWGAKFHPMFVESKKAGVTGMDLSKIHDIEQIDLPPS